MRIFYIFLVLLSLVSVQVKSQSRLPSPDQETRNIKFYPNPAITVITFDFQNSFDKANQLQIFNFLGKMLKSIAAKTYNKHNLSKLRKTCCKSADRLLGPIR